MESKIETKIDNLLSIKNLIEKEIQEIIENQETFNLINEKYINILDDKFNDLYEDLKILYNKNFFICRIIELKNLLEKVKNKIIKKCDHKLCIDHIDIRDDKLVQIEYCEKCFYTF
jgi:hypothetical protein